MTVHHKGLRGMAIGRRVLMVLLPALLCMTPAFATQTITYYHLDATGSPVAATDQTGAVVWRETYKPYGERTLNQAAAGGNSHWYTGKPYDSAIGLSYFGARYYDPVVGRFMGVDPASFTPGNLHSFNRYGYGNNNPYKYVDPDGEYSILGSLLFVATVALIYYDLSRPPVPGDSIDEVGIPVGPIKGFGGARAASKAVGEIREVTAGALKNASGDLDDAARAARTQPHNTPNLTEHARAQMNTRGVSVDQAVDAANRGSITSKAGDPVVKRLSTSSGRKIEVRQDVRTNNIVTVIDKGSAN